MKVFIKTPTGKTITITIEASMIVHDVKQNIQDSEGIPSDQQRLNFGCTQLQDAQTLITCGIREETTIQLALLMGHSVEVTVLTATGKAIVVLVDPEYLILFLKNKILDQEGIPVEQQILILSGQVLEDKRQMKHYGIKSETSMRLMILDRPFQCPVCNENFQSQGDLSPHGLTCGHSVCHRDVGRLVEEDKLSCPVCEVEMDLNLCVGGFPSRNASLMECLDRFREIWGTYGSESHESIPMCGNCDPDANQQQATVGCAACSLDLCNECDAQVHALRGFGAHQRTPVMKARPASAIAKCAIHGEALKRFCIDCRKAVCTNCVEIDGPHHSHNHRLMSAIVSEEKKKLKDHTAHCFETICDLQELMAALRLVEHDLDRNQESCLASFRADKEVVMAAMNARWDALEQGLMADAKERRLGVRAQREAAMDRLWSVDACRREAMVAMLATNLKFLAGICELSRRVEECNRAADELLKGVGAEVPSAVVGYETAADGRGRDVGQLLQAIALVDLALTPLETPRPATRRAREEARLKDEENRRVGGGDDSSSSSSEAMQYEVLKLKEKASAEIVEQRDRKIEILEDEMREPMPFEKSRDEMIADLESRNGELRQQVWQLEADVKAAQTVQANVAEAGWAVVARALQEYVQRVGATVDSDSIEKLFDRNLSLTERAAEADAVVTMCADSVAIVAFTCSDIVEALQLGQLEGEEGTLKRVLDCAEMLSNCVKDIDEDRVALTAQIARLTANPKAKAPQPSVA